MRSVEAARASWRLPFSYDGIALLALATDIALIVAASVLSGVGYHVARFGVPGDLTAFAGVAAMVAALFVPAMKLQGLYRPPELLVFGRQITTLILSWIGVFTFLAGVAFSLKIGGDFSRASIFSFAGLGLAALILHRVVWRILLAKALASGRLHGKRIALISQGKPSGPERLGEVLERHGFQVVRRLLLPETDGLDTPELRDRLLKTLTSVRGSDVEEIFIAANWRDSQEIVQLVHELRVVPLPVRFLPDPATAGLVTRPWQAMGPSVAVEIQRAPLTSLERATKRGFDLVCASVGLVILSPLLVVTALAIRLDSPGPVLFRQTRHGFNGRPFKILKFRSMTVLEDGAQVTQATRGDRRVTRVGHWLRRSSIDELPQLFNVLRGDMSIVGPRPHAVAHNSYYDELIADYALRHHVKPGLTGWAQVNGYRGETPTLHSMARRVELDLWYIDNWSLWLDLSIALRTAIEMIRPRNAY